MVKAVFFDLDGTLSVPCYMSEGKLVVGFTDEGWFNHCTGLRDHAYDYCKPVRPVERYAKALHDDGIKLYILSVAQTEGERLAKISFVNRHFKGLFEEIIFASTNAEKISIMDDYAIANGLNHNQIGIVEDTYPVVLKANDNGYAATHISEIICNL